MIVVTNASFHSSARHPSFPSATAMQLFLKQSQGVTDALLYTAQDIRLKEALCS